MTSNRFSFGNSRTNTKFMFPILLSAFLLGLAGSFHFVGMCSPIALAIPGYAGSKCGSLWLYFSGKTLTYTLLGVLFGLFGQQRVIAGLQKALSLGAGILLLVIAILMLVHARQFHQNPISNWVSKKLSAVFGRLLKKGDKTAAFYIGLLNGFLPCGLVYFGIIGSWLPAIRQRELCLWRYLGWVRFP